MPIGIPKVPYRSPKLDQLDWLDVYHRLSRERVLFLVQSVEYEVINQLICLILYLSSEEKKSDIFLYINSPGGSVICGLSLVGTIQYVRSDVHMINTGIAASVASFIVASGKKGKRLSFSHARFVVRQPEGGSKGRATEVLSEVEEVVRLRCTVGCLYSEFTGQSIHRITEDLDRGTSLNAKQACRYGLIDLVTDSVGFLF